MGGPTQQCHRQDKVGWAGRGSGDVICCGLSEIGNMRRMALKRNEDTRFDLRPKPADSYHRVLPAAARCGHGTAAQTTTITITHLVYLPPLLSHHALSPPVYLPFLLPFSGYPFTPSLVVTLPAALQWLPLLLLYNDWPLLLPFSGYPYNTLQWLPLLLPFSG